MSTVRGKAPIRLSHCNGVEHSSFGLTVTIKGIGFNNGGPIFGFEWKMEMHQAKNLVRDIRTAMRKVRDEASARLAQNVTDAEGPL